MKSHRIIGVGLTTLLGAFCAAMACVAHTSTSVDGGADDKKSPAKKSAAEIERLVKDLGSSNGAIRESADKILRKCDGALSYLRRNLSGRDVETKCRMDSIIEELARKRFQQRMAELAKEKDKVAIDVLMLLMLENKKNVEEIHWSSAIEVLIAASQKVTKGKKTQVPRPECDIQKCDNMIGSTFAEIEPIIGARVIADGLATQGFFANSLAILSDRFEAPACADSYLLLGGSVREPLKGGKRLCNYARCFIFCDGDFLCESVGGCIVVATGAVRAKRIDHSIVIEGARRSDLVTLFSADLVGMKLVQEGDQVRVDKVIPSSRSEKCGIKVGDLLRVSEMQKCTVAKVERLIRNSFVKEMDLELKVHRAGRELKIVLSFLD